MIPIEKMGRRHKAACPIWSVVLVLFKFEIGRGLLTCTVIAANTHAHDDITYFPDRSQFGSFVVFLHFIHLLSFANWPLARH